jgi:signal transduction histidine kinase/tetratricopeptide (TPR) repeat protein
MDGSMMSTALAQDMQKPSRFGERFRLRQTLGRAGGIRTCIALDLETHHNVILKWTLPSIFPLGAQQRLQHEANFLRRVSGCREGALLALGYEGQLVYWARRFAVGRSLAHRLRGGSMSLLESLKVASTVLQVLARAHAGGLVHCNLKPGNVLLHSKSDSGVSLLDFGVTRDLDVGIAAPDLTCAARYLSPEQAGLVGHGVDCRTDLYALGLILFACLTGAPPFRAETLRELVRAHAIQSAPPLIDYGVAAPLALEDLLHRLLQKDPRDRYQSAEAALGDIGLLVRALESGERDPRLVIGLQDRRRTPTEPSFVGRAQELEGFERAMALAAQGRGGTLVIAGPSGLGKTRLLDQMARRAAQGDRWVLRGQASRVCERPLDILAESVRDVVARAQCDLPFAHQLVTRLGDLADDLCATLPALRAVVQPDSSQPLGPEAFREARTIKALSEFVLALGSSEQPAVLLFDDCQWADELFFKLLSAGLLAGEGNYLLIVVAHRTTEAGEAAQPLRAIPGRRFELAPLDPEESRSLLESMAGPLPEVAVNAIAKAAAGSPFMTRSLFRELIATGGLESTSAGWRLTASSLETMRSSDGAAELLERRLLGVPAEILHVLSAGAILGQQFDLSLASRMADVPTDRALVALRNASLRDIVWMDARGMTFTFVHDRLRDALLARMVPEQRRRLHALAADSIEAIDSDRPSRAFDLAYHFDAAGQIDRAAGYARIAAEEARARFSLAMAERHYLIALRGATDPIAASAFQESLGEVQMLRGAYPQAEQSLMSARAAAASALTGARIDVKLGELAFKRGHNRQAIERLESALRSLGCRVPRRMATTLVLLLWEILVQVAHTLAPKWLLARLGDRDEKQFLAARLYSRLAYTYWFHRGPIHCAWAHLREMNLLERYAPSSELAQAYSEHGPAMTMVPWFGRGLAYAERSLAIRRKLGDVWGQGQSLHFAGVVLYGASRFDECINSCTQAVTLLRRTGDLWEANDAALNVALALLRRGRVGEAVEWSRRLHSVALAVGDTHATGISIEVWSKATGGKVPAGLLAAEVNRVTDDVQTHSEVLQAEAVRLLGDGESEAARRVLERAQTMVDRAHLRQEYSSPISGWLTTALRRELEDTSLLAGAQRRQLRAQAQKACGRALRVSRRFRNNAPHALRELGLLSAMDGRYRRARKAFDRSLAVAVGQGAELEAAITRRARAMTGRIAGWADAAADERLSEAALHSEDAIDSLCIILPRGVEHRARRRPTLSFIDRFAMLVEFGRSIASSLTRQQAIDRVQEASKWLLRSERSAVFMGSPPELAGGDEQCVLSRAVWERMAEGGPAIVLDEAECRALAIGSGICAPILMRGRVVGCLYCVATVRERVFGSIESTIAEFLATLAGAALENAEGFAELRHVLGERERLIHEAREALRVRDEFLSIASHELRTPLTSTKLQVQSLLRAAQEACVRATGRSAERLERLERNVLRMERLIDELLDVSRITSGKVRLERKAVDLELVARDTIERFAEQAGQAGCSVTLQCTCGATVGYWDRLRIEQIVTNLLSNAIKYGHGKPIETLIESTATSAMLTVVDHGVGIAPADHHRIFQRFERATSERHYGGFGLGLWITRQLVEAHGGRISVASRMGEGASFRVELPLSRSQSLPD